jgi:nitroreductase
MTMGGSKMDAIDAILNRHSVRDFSPKPVPKETLMKIFEAALNSPSGGNGQPWEVFVAAGAKMDRIRKIYKESAGGPPPGGPPPMPAFMLERMKVIRNERFKLLGLNPEDPASGKVFMEWGTKLFGAPSMAVICMDNQVLSNLDIGLFVQTVCIAAQGYGVDSFIATSLVMKQDVLRAELDIPPNLNIITGVALGYAAPDAIINTYRSPRRPLKEVVRYKDR